MTAPADRPPEAFFASPSLGQHLLRRALALLLLGAAIHLQDTQPAWAVAAAVGAVVAFRGCPMCWAIGLLETLRQQRSR